MESTSGQHKQYVVHSGDILMISRDNVRVGKTTVDDWFAIALVVSTEPVCDDVNAFKFSAIVDGVHVEEIYKLITDENDTWKRIAPSESNFKL